MFSKLVQLYFLNSHTLISYIIDLDTIFVDLITFSLAQYHMSLKFF